MLILTLKQGEGINIYRANKRVGRIHCKHMTKSIVTLSFDLPNSLIIERDTAKKKIYGDAK